MRGGWFVIITEFDPIDIPAETAREREPIHLIQRRHPAWPDAEFTILFDWNNAGAFWVWEVRLDEYGTIIERQPAEYSHNYWFGQYVFFTFLDLGEHAEEVTPNTLGSAVDLIAVPGLKSPGFGEWLERQSVPDDEKQQLLADWKANVIQ